MAGLPAERPLLTARSGRVKTARRLARRVSRAERRQFLVEGPQAVREALALPDCTVEVYAVPGAEATHPELASAAHEQDCPWHLVDESALSGLAETVHPQGVVAVCRFLDRPLGEVVADVLPGQPRLVVICADIRDPGNAGTVIRCADAAGADAVVLTGSSVDPYNGKAVRASVGSLFHLPLAIAADTAVAVATLREAGCQVLAADGGGDLDLDDAADDGLLARPTAWMFGNEAWGLPSPVAELADRQVRIPIHGRAESLNLATAAAVCLYASARAQRRAGR
jgi:TrmH family RNA methyltransferase